MRGLYTTVYTRGPVCLLLIFRTATHAATPDKLPATTTYLQVLIHPSGILGKRLVWDARRILCHQHASLAALCRRHVKGAVLL